MSDSNNKFSDCGDNISCSRETVGAGPLPRLRPGPAPPEHGLVSHSLEAGSVRHRAVAVTLTAHVRPDGLQHGALAILAQLVFYMGGYW